MKKLTLTKILPVMAFIAIGISVLNYRSDKRNEIAKAHMFKRDTPFELGEFVYADTIYAVFGTSSPNKVTDVQVFSYTAPWYPVYSFTPFHIGWTVSGGVYSIISLSNVKQTASSTPFNIGNTTLEYY